MRNGSQPPPPSGHLLPEEGGRYENAAFPILSFRANARNLFRSRSEKRCEERGRGNPRTPKQLGITVLHADGFTKENGKRKRSLGYARDDETRKCLYPFLFSLRQPTSAPLGHLLPEEGGRYENAAQGLSLNPLEPTIYFHRKEHS